MRPNRWLISLLAFALAARIVFAVFVVGWQRAPIGDENDYHGLASNLATGTGYVLDGEPTARRPPLYPVTLSVLYKIVGPRVTWARGLQALLGVLAVWLTFIVAQRYTSRRNAWIAAVLCAVNPFLIFMSGFLLTENLYVVFLLLFLLVTPRPDALHATWWRTAAAGVLVGLSSLARPTAFGFGLWAVFFLWLFGRASRRKRLVHGALFLLVVFVTLLPWGIRNRGAFGKWMFFTSHGGITFYQGNNESVLDVPQYRGGVAPYYMLPRADELEGLGVVEYDEAAWAMGRQFLADHKDKIPVLVWRKFVRFWRLRSDAPMSGIGSGWWFDTNSTLGRLAVALDPGFIYGLFVIPLFTLGMIVCLRSGRRWIYPYGIVIVHTLVTLVFHGSLRMRLPIEPLMAIFAAEGVSWVIVRVRSAVGKPQETDQSFSPSPRET